MKFQIGDKILLLHSKEEGEVKEILTDDMLLVEVDGIRFPVYQDQVDFPYFHRFTKNLNSKKFEEFFQEETSSQKEKLSGEIREEGMLIEFNPVFDKDVFDEDVVKYLKVKLSNQTQSAYKIVGLIKFKERVEEINVDLLNPWTVGDLQEIDFETMNDSPKYEFTFFLHPEQKGKEKFFQVSFKPKAKVFFKRLEEMQLNKKKSFAFVLFEKYPDEKINLVPDYNAAENQPYKAENIKEELPPPRTVVDLHIDKLDERWKALSNFEMLQIQLAAFEKYYELAVAHRQPHLIIIHGVGSGKLKNEIHDLLKNKKEVKSFANQYHPNFGFGATEIFFQY